MKRSAHNRCQGEPSMKKENQAGQCWQWRRGELLLGEGGEVGASPRRCRGGSKGKGVQRGTALGGSVICIH